MKRLDNTPEGIKMDTFEETMVFMARLSEEDKKKINKQDRERCLCPTCPTYADCARKKKENLFCFEGKSSCILVDKGCHCHGMPGQGGLRPDQPLLLPEWNGAGNPDVTPS